MKHLLKWFFYGLITILIILPIYLLSALFCLFLWDVRYMKTMDIFENFHLNK